MAAEDELRDCRKGAIADVRQDRRRVWELEEKGQEPITFDTEAASDDELFDLVDN
ncbi:hypothetical protein [Frankia sp. Cas3]|uniref:hypothetical protein n=1 Tax=Frankia sp. Cas3 TaxID=3073926 RepID=UPI002AD52414|nr:hypothetical protein [Frankia sp. Cas3]